MNRTSRSLMQTLGKYPANGLETMASWFGRKSVRRAISVGLTLISLIIAGFFFLGPFYWMVITALKPQDQLFTMPLVFWPREFQWSILHETWIKAPFLQYLTNTAIITGASVIGRTMVAAIVGYGFAVGRFWGRNVLFVVLLATMMIPPQITLVPLFVIFRYLGWLNTFLPLIVPSFLGVGGAFYIFLMRQFFLTIPVELEDAARIDGASTIRILWNIYLPLSKPALVTVALFTFMQTWNDFFGPLIYLTKKENWTLILGLMALIDPMFTDYRPQLTGALLVSLPAIVIFFLAQRFFTRGIALTGLKG